MVCSQHLAWTCIHQSVVFPLSSSLFLKAHRHVLVTLSRPVGCVLVELMPPLSVDVPSMCLELMLNRSYQKLLWWSLVSRTHTVHYTVLSVTWTVPSVMCVLTILACTKNRDSSLYTQVAGSHYHGNMSSSNDEDFALHNTVHLLICLRVKVCLFSSIWKYVLC